MKRYRRINQFMLEHFPVLWNTHFVWLVGIGILLHLIFYAAGYGILNITRMKDYNVGQLFYTTPMFGLYILLCLMLLIYFAFRYYAHNPFRNFYPLSRTYFWKVFLSLLTVIMLFISVFFSFEQGMVAKAKKEVPVAELMNDIDQVNLAFPFLFNDINNYHITGRVYPKPFPLENLAEFQIGYDTLNELAIKHGIDHQAPYVTLNNKEFQFGRLKMEDKDSCHSIQVIDSIIDVSKVYDLNEYSITNFHSVWVTYAEEDGDEFQRYAPRIHAIARSGDATALHQVFTRLMQTCDRYRINYQLNPDKMTAAILRQHLDTEQLISVGFYDYTDPSTAQPMTVGSDYSENENNHSRKGIDYNYSADLHDFQNIVNNKQELEFNMGYHRWVAGDVWILIFASLFLTLLFMVTKYLKLKFILIGMVIAGIITTVVSLFLYGLSFTYRSSSSHGELVLLTQVLVVCFIVSSLGTLLIYAKRYKKNKAYALFISTITAILGLLPLSLTAIYEYTRYEIKDKCAETYSTFYRFELYPVYFLALFLCALHLIFMLMRRLHAKEE